MVTNLYSISYKENGKIEKELVSSVDILFALKLFSKTYPSRIVLSITYQSQVLV